MQKVLIVAKCNVNLQNALNPSFPSVVLIVAKCNVNARIPRHLMSSLQY